MLNNFCVAISGKSGCGNTTVSRLTAEKLKFRVVNFTFKNLAAELGMKFEELCNLAEEDPKYDRIIDKRQVELASKEDCVLASRLAIWMMKEAQLKVYLNVPEEIRAKRIHEREGGSFEKIFAETVERDKRDRKRYLELYGIDNDRYDFVDMVIDAEKFDQFRITDMITEQVLDINRNRR